MGKKNKNKAQAMDDAEETGDMTVPAATADESQEPEAATGEDGDYDESIRTTADNVDLKKKNTRKKKNKGGAQLIDDEVDEDQQAQALAAKNAQADMLAAFADDGDYQERKGQNKKKGARVGKKGKKAQEDEEEEKAEEPAAEEELKESEKPTVADEEDAEEEKPEFPLNVAYCPSKYLNHFIRD